MTIDSCRRVLRYAALLVVLWIPGLAYLAQPDTATALSGIALIVLGLFAILGGLVDSKTGAVQPAVWTVLWLWVGWSLLLMVLHVVVQRSLTSVLLVMNLGGAIASAWLGECMLMPMWYANTPGAMPALDATAADFPQICVAASMGVLFLTGIVQQLWPVLPQLHERSGAAVRPGDPPEPRCPACNALYDPVAKFCPACGIHLAVYELD